MSRNRYGNQHCGRKSWTVIDELLVGCCEQFWELKLQGDPMLLWVSPSSGTRPGSHSEDQRKIPTCFQQEEGKRGHFEVYQSALFLTRPETMRNYFPRAQPTWEKGNTWLLPPVAILPHLRGKNPQSLVKFRAWGTGSLQDWDLITGLENALPSSHLTTTFLGAYLPAVPLTQYVMSIFQQKITRHTKRQKTTQLEEIEQASDPGSHMAGMLELWDQEIKITMTVR